MTGNVCFKKIEILLHIYFSFILSFLTLKIIT